ncbi:uncharacterized protein LOC113796898 isoform X2 [Dermatophagoides pteronyssinus]|uniref:uncharacterized protein LOC113796898 isoform X2 n=1 Tax=Dermatophagoides pteronyssinus TaxID=6956 RepID=UPI003F67C8EC
MASLQYQARSEYSSTYNKGGSSSYDSSLERSKSPLLSSGGGGGPLITSAFVDGSPSSGVGTSTQDYSYATTTSSTSPLETIVQEYQTADGGIGKRVLKTFTTQQTTTKTTRYGSDGALRTETTTESGPYIRQTSPMPARSSSSMSKLTHHIDENCKHQHGHHQKVLKSNSRPLTMDGNPPAGYSLYHVERREETSRTSSGGGSQIPTTPSRKVKFQDEEYINRKEFEQACSSLQSSTKDIDILPDPELDTDISLHTIEKTHTRKAHRIKEEGEKFEYNDFAMIPPTASKSPLPHRKTESRDRSPAPTMDPRAPSPVHQLIVPQKYIETRTPSPKDKIEQHGEHNCKYHSHHLDYKYTPPPVKGPCGACGQYIVGSLVTALDQMWHPECFTCTNCDTILKPHKYVVEDDKPYCKDCHLRLFGPPCNVCKKPTQSNRYNLLNRIWHPECFCCVECGKRLTPDNFVERLGSPYCMEDYHRLFSPKCCVCHLPIKDKAINALGKMWHPQCFKCTHCGIPLEERNFYEKNGLPYCEKDYMDLFHPKCYGCKKPITDGRQMIAMGHPWHPECFRCTVCVKPLTPETFKEYQGKPYCEKDYHNLFSPKCAGCTKPITDGKPVFNKGQYWHPDCDALYNRPTPPPPPPKTSTPLFQHQPPPPEIDIESLLEPLLQEKPSRPIESYHVDTGHNLPPIRPDCDGCQGPIVDSNYIRAMGKDWHPNCFQCHQCKIPLDPENFYEKNGKPYCENDYHKLFSPKCFACSKPIRGTPLRALGHDWHPECFNCDKCRVPLSPDNFLEKNGRPYCPNCFDKLFLPKCFSCSKPIQGTPLRAMGHDWHPECFNCDKCRVPLSPDNFLEKNGRPYCPNCFDKLFMPKCYGCSKPIKGTPLRAMGHDWHPECFNCDKCHIPLSPDNYYEKNGRPYCENDYHKLFSPKCCACNKPIKERPIFALGKEWHPQCFVCSHPSCDRVLDPNDFETHDGKPYCKFHFGELFLPKCFACKKPITDKVVSALGKTWHPECFACVQCGVPLDLNAFREKDGLPYCEADYHALFSPKCAACEAPIVEKCLTALNKTWHPEHFTCAHCNKAMSDDPDGYHEHDSKGYCRPCYIELFAPYCRGCNKPIVDKICVTALNSKYHTDCFVCRDCGCALKNGNYFEFEGEPYCEEHFRCKMCPDCVRLRRAQNKFFSGAQQQQSTTNQHQHPVPQKMDSYIQQKVIDTATMPTNTQQKVTFANGTLPSSKHQQPLYTTSSTLPHHRTHDLIRHSPKKIADQQQQRTTSPYSIRLGA